MRVEHVELYRDQAGEVRWRWVAANAKTMGDSSEGYVNASWVVRQARRLAEALGVPLVDHRTR